MRNCFVLLLFVCVSLATNSVWGQSLTLGQLIQLSKQDGLTSNSYLISRGWVFGGRRQVPSDSSSGTLWVYEVANNRRIAELERQVKVGTFTLINYATSSYVVFESVRQQAVGYKMELIGEAADGDAIASQYRGDNYDLWLSIFKPKEEPTTTWYNVELRKHGLTKGIKMLANGETETVWIDKITFTPGFIKKFMQVDSATIPLGK